MSKSKKTKKTDAQPKTKLSSSFSILKESLHHLWLYKKVFSGLLAVYLILMMLLVKGFGLNANIPELKSAIQSASSGVDSSLTTSFTLYGKLVNTSSGTSGDVASLYQMIILVVVSLALIWALRQTYAKVQIGVREAFYRGMYPLVPFLLVLFLIGIELLPLVFSTWIFTQVTLNEIVVSSNEKLIWSAVAFGLALSSLYMISSSLIALYISTLQDMLPRQALRSARELVRHRRWSLMRKIVFLPIVLLLAGLVIMTPVIWLVPVAAEAVFFVISMFALIIVHSYMYALYRKLL